MTRVLGLSNPSQMGLRGGSVDKVLVMHTRGHEFELQAPYKKPHVVAHIHDTNSPRWEAERRAVS